MRVESPPGARPRGSPALTLPAGYGHGVVGRAAAAGRRRAALSGDHAEPAEGRRPADREQPRQRDYASSFGGAIAPDFLQRGRDGEIYSIHAPGVAVLVLPAFALFGYRGAQVTVLLLAAIAAR